MHRTTPVIPLRVLRGLLRGDLICNVNSNARYSACVMRNDWIMDANGSGPYQIYVTRPAFDWRL